MPRSLQVEPLWLRRALLAQGKKDALRTDIKSTPTPENVTVATPPAENVPKIELQKPPKEELMLLDLALAERANLDQILQANVLGELSPNGVDRIFKEIELEYRQNPNNFDRLSVLLTDKVQDPSVVTGYLSRKLVTETEGEAVRLTDDCIKRVRDRNLRAKTRKLTEGLKSRQGDKQLEEFRDLVRSRQSLHDNKDDR